MSFSTKGSIPEIGAIVKHPSGKKVKIIKYSFSYGLTGGMEVFLFWREVLKDNTLGNKIDFGKSWF
jgi:hypothetical protein